MAFADAGNREYLKLIKCIERMFSLIDFIGSVKVHGAQRRVSVSEQEDALIVLRAPEGRPPRCRCLGKHTLRLVWAFLLFLITLILPPAFLWAPIGALPFRPELKALIFSLLATVCLMYSLVALRQGLVDWETNLLADGKRSSAARGADFEAQRRLLLSLTLSFAHAQPLAAVPLPPNTSHLETTVRVLARCQGSATVPDIRYNTAYSSFHKFTHGYAPASGARPPVGSSPIVDAGLGCAVSALEACLHQIVLFRLLALFVQETALFAAFTWHCLSFGLRPCSAASLSELGRWLTERPSMSRLEYPLHAAALTIWLLLFCNEHGLNSCLKPFSTCLEVLSCKAPRSGTGRRLVLATRGWIALGVHIAGYIIVADGSSFLRVEQWLVLSTVMLIAESLLTAQLRSSSLSSMLGYPLWDSSLLAGSPQDDDLTEGQWQKKLKQCADRGDLRSAARCGICWDSLGSAQAMPSVLSSVSALDGLDNSYLMRAWQFDPACVHLTSCGHAFHATCMLSCAVEKPRTPGYERTLSVCPLCNVRCTGLPVLLVPKGQTQAQRAMMVAQQLENNISALRVQGASMLFPAQALLEASVQFNSDVTGPSLISFSHSGWYHTHAGMLHRKTAEKEVPRALILLDSFVDLMKSAREHIATLRALASPPPAKALPPTRQQTPDETASAVTRQVKSDATAPAVGSSDVAGMGIGGMAPAAATSASSSARRRGRGGRQGSRAAGGRDR